MRKRALLYLTIAVLTALQVAQGRSISFVGEGFIPEPNEEVTVYVQTDTPLYLMAMWIEVVGDANITSAMSEADCNNYGWANGWSSDPDIEPKWVWIHGVAWPGEANGIIGYFKFRYYSGEVTVSIADEWSNAYDTNCALVPFSTEPLVFGEPDPNRGGGDSPGEIPPIDSNLPLVPVIPAQRDRPQKVLLHCPPASDSNTAPFSRAAYEEWVEEHRDDREGRPDATGFQRA